MDEENWLMDSPNRKLRSEGKTSKQCASWAMILKSKLMISSTLGWRTLTATVIHLVSSGRFCVNFGDFSQLAVELVVLQTDRLSGHLPYTKKDFI